MDKSIYFNSIYNAKMIAKYVQDIEKSELWVATLSQKGKLQTAKMHEENIAKKKKQIVEAMNNLRAELAGVVIYASKHHAEYTAKQLESECSVVEYKPKQQPLNFLVAKARKENKDGR